MCGDNAMLQAHLLAMEPDVFTTLGHFPPVGIFGACQAKS